MSENSCCNTKFNEGGKTVRNNVGNAVYGLGFVGAAIYFIQHAMTFWYGVLGFLKAIIWPVFVVYKLLEFLKL